MTGGLWCGPVGATIRRKAYIGTDFCAAPRFYVPPPVPGSPPNPEATAAGRPSGVGKAGCALHTWLNAAGDQIRGGGPHPQPLSSPTGEGSVGRPTARAQGVQCRRGEGLRVACANID